MARPKKNLKFGAGLSTPRKTGPGAGAAGGGKDGRKVGGAPERKKGFQVGPAHAPRNAYLGKAKKIKDDLIMKSKLKREYAKVLKEEGVESTRLKARPKAGQVAEENARPFGADVGAGETSDNKDTPGRGSSLKRKQSERSDREDRRPKDGQKREGRDDRPPDGERGAKRQHSDRKARMDQPRKVRALSPGDIGPPMPMDNLRELKKEAFKKYHPAKPAPSAKGASRSVSGASDTTRNSAGGFGGSLARVFSGASGSSAGGTRKGQPNMAARMGALLEQIKRDRS